MNSRALHRLASAGPAVAALLLAACGAPPPPPARKPPPVPQQTTALADEKPAAAQSIYVYSPVGKRDPFQNVFAVKEVTPVKVPGAKPTPLQKWPIDRLKLVMTMTGTSSPLAMVEDPDGRGWSVRIGTFVGQNWWKVTSIQRDQIIITETITDHATGRVYPNALPLKVARDASELADFKQLSEGETLGAAQSNPGN
jgi:type IV pilus assembly protein PilP